MISELAVFAWLPGENTAVPAGILEIDEDGTEVVSSNFVYGTRYLERPNRLEIDPVGLGLARGQNVVGVRLFPPNELTLFGGIRDAAPDAWGRRVIENRLGAPANGLPESEYLLRAGSNRAGALDIRRSLDAPPEQSPVGSERRLNHLLAAADAIEQGMPVPANLHEIFDAGSSFGGMRPKAAVVDDQGRHWLAKFPSRNDRGFSVPTIEYAVMRLAHDAGLDTPEVRLVHVGERRAVLLTERFDRVRVRIGAKTDPKRKGGAAPETAVERRHFVSALTLLAVDESRSPDMSYADIAHCQALYGPSGGVVKQQRELFARMVFNIFVSNDDDHLRNHAFLWTGDGWTLSPLFDVVPRAAIATERTLHLAVGTQGRAATLPNAMSRHAVFGLDRNSALAVIDTIGSVVREWRTRFEEYGIEEREIDLAAPAFRKAEDAGGKELRRNRT